MKKTTYTNPKMKFIDIVINNLCAGSTCTTINLDAIKIKEMDTRRKTFSLKDGNSENMWDTKF